MGVHYPNEAPLTRRAFLRLSAVTAAGLALAACAPAAPTQLTEADSAKAASLSIEEWRRLAALVKATQVPTVAPTGRESDFSNRWPETAQDFLKAIQVSQDRISAEYLADPYYRPLQAGMLTQEFDGKGKWTGGWQVLFERNAGDKDKFPFVVIQNPGPMMQYGYMHDSNLRKQAGFTAQEVQLLGIGQNHIGAGIPVTKKPIAVEGLTFYPFTNTVDGSNNRHFIYAKLGPDVQTLDARLARLAKK